MGGVWWGRDRQPDGRMTMKEQKGEDVRPYEREREEIGGHLLWVRSRLYVIKLL